ncbi:MAG TPA: heavy-metal-associated domain-containing protein [Candidatus Nanoarchaeia archaeon]|nr:heavy-metal-associated domain-containing protein [Candidatus Nanoarchaeia archaeon]
MKKTFNVSGMHCPSCEILITDSLMETPGVANAAASEKAGTVDVEFDEKKVNESKIKDIIKKEGYRVK